MRRLTPILAAALLSLTATPAFAADTEEPMAEGASAQQVEVPEVGLAIEFPADWTVRTPLGPRVSEIQRPDGEPVLVTTAIMANVNDGRWCDIDVYLDMPASLSEHAAAYAIYLQQVHGAGIPVTVGEIELPAGAAYRLSVIDPDRERVWAKYLFDGPIGEDGTVDRFLLTCVGPVDAEPFSESIAQSAEVFPALEPEATEIMGSAEASEAPEA